MNKALKYSLSGLGGVTLFLGTYVAIALVSGAPLDQVPGISMFVDAPEEIPGEELDEELAKENMKREERTGSDLLEANVGLLGAFMMESPFSASELRALEGELKKKLREQTIDRQGMEVRGLELDEWENSLRERQTELADRRTKLEELESKIELRFSELEYTEAVNKERELQGWSKLAEVYKESDPQLASSMLLEEQPEDGALILAELGAKTAGEILRNIPVASKRKEYMDAYRKVAGAAEKDGE